MLPSTNMSRENRCEHFVGAKENQVPKTSGCKECQVEGTDWVALRMCLVCGHVGCCDSSVGLHATKHYKETNHPVMVALPNKQWRWCYVHREYS